MSTTLILGGGFGGIACARALRSKLPPAHHVTLVDRAADFTVGAAKPWVMLGERTPGRPRGSAPPCSLTGRAAAGRRARDRPAHQGGAHVGGRPRGGPPRDRTGAEHDMGAVPGLVGAAQQFYSLDGAVRLREVLAEFAGGRSCCSSRACRSRARPVPTRGSSCLHAALAERGLRAKTRSRSGPSRITHGDGRAEMGRRSSAPRGAGHRIPPAPQGVAVDGAARTVRFETGPRRRTTC